MARCSGSSLVGASAAATGVPSSRCTPTRSADMSAYSRPLGVTATRSPLRTLTFPAVPTTSPAADSSRQTRTISWRMSRSSIAYPFPVARARRASGRFNVMRGDSGETGTLDDVLAWRDGHIVAIDQTVLPRDFRVLHIITVDELVDAITRLAIRGAPALGVAGALGVALAVRQAEREGWGASRLAAEVERIAGARPTAVNLRMSERGARYLSEAAGTGPLTIHTHCNTGTLACLGWGSALGVIRALHEKGQLRQVIVDETRPLLQGARLTCWELGQLRIGHSLISDGAGPFVISQGLADAVVVGADRVAANGDVANKIGTYALALAARQAGIPFVVVVPESTIDDATENGQQIPLERRPEDEVTHILGVQAAPAGTHALNYAFDVTPAELVTAIVTEDRLIFPSATAISAGG